jgi:4,5-DOPA dioxygenase extradiol
MYPEADVPVLQISLPGLDPGRLLALGRTLAPLRDEGVLIVGSGFLTHNMRAIGGATQPWAVEFDNWVADAIARRDLDALAAFQTVAPAARTALPTTEHYAPLLVAAGAAAEKPGSVKFPVSGFAFGSFTKRSVEFG